MVELADLDGAIIFKDGGETEAYFPDQTPESALAPHLEKMALLMFISNDEELLKFAQIKHLKQLENPN
jgi:hypothetical protein